MRAANADDALQLIPPKIMSLEQAIEFIKEDELVEVTLESIRLRKKILEANKRR
jgi:GTP-binding protein